MDPFQASKFKDSRLLTIIIKINAGVHAPQNEVMGYAVAAVLGWNETETTDKPSILQRPAHPLVIDSYWIRNWAPGARWTHGHTIDPGSWECA